MLLSHLYQNIVKLAHKMTCESAKCYSTAIHTTIMVVLSLQLLGTIEKQVFDFLGYMWAPIIGNFFQIICTILGIFGTYQYRPKFIAVYSTWSLIWLGWNIFVICLYLEVGVLNRNKELYILTMGTKTKSWWLDHGIGCRVNNESWTDGTGENGRQIPPEEFVEGCILEYYYVEVIHAGIQCLFALTGFVFTLMAIYIYGEDQESSKYPLSTARTYLSPKDYPSTFYRPIEALQQARSSWCKPEYVTYDDAMRWAQEGPDDKMAWIQNGQVEDSRWDDSGQGDTDQWTQNGQADEMGWVKDEEKQALRWSQGHLDDGQPEEMTWCYEDIQNGKADDNGWAQSDPNRENNGGFREDLETSSNCGPIGENKPPLIPLNARSLYKNGTGYQDDGAKMDCNHRSMGNDRYYHYNQSTTGNGVGHFGKNQQTGFSSGGSAGDQAVINIGTQSALQYLINGQNTYSISNYASAPQQQQQGGGHYWHLNQTGTRMRNCDSLSYHNGYSQNGPVDHYSSPYACHQRPNYCGNAWLNGPTSLGSSGGGGATVLSQSHV